MSDQNNFELSMRITGEKNQKLAKWLDSRNIQHACPTCGSSKILVQELCVMPVVGEDRNLTDRAFVVVPIVCLNCGSVRLFSATTVGIAD